MNELNEILDESDELYGFTAIQLAEFWNILNCWGWPEEIPNPEPVPEKIIDRACPRRTELRHRIECLVGHKLCNRIGNKDMTDEEHEDFWRGWQEGDEGARLRDSARRWAKVLKEDN